MQPVRIPRHVDSARHLMLWRADELIPVAVLMGVGFFTGYFVTCTAIGITLTMLLRRFTAARPDGYMLHALYYYGLAPLKGESILNPFVKKVLP